MPSVVDAIVHKYGAEDEESVELPIAIYVPKTGPRKCLPSLLVLDNCGIDCAGEDDELKHKCEGVRELDLAQNKLTQWEEVLKILRPMNQVSFVNLSFNSLSHPLPPPVCQGLHLPRLSTLILNGTHVSWASVQLLLNTAPSLEELGLNLNEYGSVDLADAIHEHVKLVYFNANPVRVWSHVCRLGIAFPQLETLVLADCPIESLCLTNENDSPSPQSSPAAIENDSEVLELTAQTFQQLMSLNLNNTLISTWEDIDRLRRFPKLKEVRIQGCPLFEESTEHERRRLLIARLPNIEKINGGAIITPLEREDSERAFIRYFMDRVESQQPTRYHELVSRHGKLDPLVIIDLRPETRLEVKVTFEERQATQQINVYQTVRELKTHLEAFAGIPANRMKLFFLDQEGCMGAEEMRFPNKRLLSYNIYPGDTIIVALKSG